MQAQTGEYLNFDGVDDAITATQQTTVKDNFTIEFWARPTETIALPAQATGGADAIGGGRFVIFPVWGPSIAGGGSSGAGVSVGTNGVCVVEHGDGYVPSLLTWAGTVSGWTHIVVVYTNKQPTLYINGALVATGVTSVQPNVFVTTTNYGGGPFGHFSGDMDELRIWDRSLTASEILARTTTELVGNEAGLIDYYNFNQGIAAGTNPGVTTFKDATTPRNNGTLNGFALTGTASNWLAPSPFTLCTIVPAVSITANPNGTIIAGTSVTFTAVPTNGGTAPTYTWKKGSITVGTNSETYIDATLKSGDVITCVMTPSPEICAAVGSATSNEITIAVFPTPSVAIASSSAKICAGTSVTFTATPTNGGTAPTYVWKNGSTNVGTGATYSTTGLANNDVITCVMTSNLANASPTTVTSAGITMVVNTPPATPVISGATTFCTTTLNTQTQAGATYCWTNSSATPA